VPASDQVFAASQTQEVGDAIAEVWERILGVPASRGDHLLDVLVNSHGMERSRQLGLLLSEIGVATGVSLPLTIAYESPSAAALTQKVQKGTWPHFQRPVRLQSGVGEPLFVLPGAGGLGLDVIMLVRYLTFPGPIFLNPPRGVDGDEPHRALDAIVADHVAILRNIQPHGPYWLLGHSWGGLIALEIARVLRACGETIAFLGMIEPVVGELDWTYRLWLEYMGKRFRYHLAELRQIGSPSAAARYVSKRLTPLFGRIGRLFGYNKWSGLAGAVGTLPGPLGAVVDAEIELIDAYRLRYYDGAATLFATRAGHAADCDPEKIWPGKLRSFDLQWVEGNHESILTEPGVKSLARQVSASLASHR